MKQPSVPRLFLDDNREESGSRSYRSGHGNTPARNSYYSSKTPSRKLSNTNIEPVTPSPRTRKTSGGSSSESTPTHSTRPSRSPSSSSPRTNFKSISTPRSSTQINNLRAQARKTLTRNRKSVSSRRMSISHTSRTQSKALFNDIAVTSFDDTNINIVTDMAEVEEAEDIEEVIARIVKNAGIDMSAQKINDYADILKQNLVFTINEVSCLDADSWMMLLHSGFPLRLRQLLLNEAYKGSNNKNEPQEQVEVVGVFDQISSLWKRVTGNTTPTVSPSENRIESKATVKTDPKTTVIPPIIANIEENQEEEAPYGEEFGPTPKPTLSEARNLDFLYSVSRMVHMRGDYTMSTKEAITLASLCAHIVNGDYNDSIDRNNFFSNMGEWYFPPNMFVDDMLVDPVIEDGAFNLYSKLIGMSKEEAKLRYVRAFKNLKKNDGITRFFVTNKVRGRRNRNDPRSKDNWMLGISKDKVYKLLIESDLKETIDTEWDFAKIRRWRFDQSTRLFTLELVDSTSIEFIVGTEEGINISGLLFYSIDLDEENERNNKRLASETEREKQKSSSEIKKSIGIEVKLPSDKNTILYEVNILDTVANTCVLIAKYLKFEIDGRYGLRNQRGPRNRFLPLNTPIGQLDLGGVFIFATRLYIPSPLFSQTREDYIDFLFQECREGIVEEGWNIDKEAAIKLSSLYLQYTNGDYKQQHTKKFFSDSLLKTLPQKWIKQPGLIEDIVKDYKTLTEISKINAGVRYIEIVKKLPSYGDSNFIVHTNNGNIILSISYSKICIKEVSSKEIKSSYPLDMIQTKTVENNMIDITFANGVQFEFTSDNSTQIDELINDYIAISKNANSSILQPEISKCSVM